MIISFNSNLNPKYYFYLNEMKSLHNYFCYLYFCGFLFFSSLILIILFGIIIQVDLHFKDTLKMAQVYRAASLGWLALPIYVFFYNCCHNFYILIHTLKTEYFLENFLENHRDFVNLLVVFFIVCDHLFVGILKLFGDRLLRLVLIRKYSFLERCQEGVGVRSHCAGFVQKISLYYRFRLRFLLIYFF